MSVSRVHGGLRVGLLLALGLSACKGACGESEPASEAPSSSALALAGEEGCRFDTVVATDLPADFDCVSASGAGFVGARVGVSKGLAGYCALRLPKKMTSKAASTEVALAAARGRLPEGVRVSPDCVVVEPFGAPVDAEAWSRFARAAGRPVGRVELEAPPVRVAVIDTPSTSSAAHGDRVADIARRMGCAAPSELALGDATSAGCALEVAREVALARRDPRLGEGERGGYRGSLSELAGAIDRALAASPPGRRLVLNLSLGWDPRAGGLFTDPRRGESAAVGAVHRALQVAGCRGAVVVVASGAESDWVTGDVDPRPTWPAGWTVTTRPEPERCAAWIDGVDPATYDASAPYVLAVGALGDFEDPEGEEARALSVDREGSAPTLYAYGRFPAAGLVGSSAAAPVVSAALAWTMVAAPADESTGDIVRELVRAGARIHRAPAVDLPLASATQADRARFIRPCLVLDELCSEDACDFARAEGSWCPSSAGLPELPEGEPRTLSVPAGRTCDEAPSVTVFDDDAEVREEACEAHRSGTPGLRPFSSRRGRAASCAACVGRAVAGEKAVELALELRPDALEPAYLVFDTGRQSAVHPLGALGLGPGRSHRLRLELPGPVPRTLEARIFFRAEEGGLVAEDIALRRR